MENKILIFVLMLVLTSCNLPKNEIIVWNATDIIGAIIGIITLSIIGILLLIAKILDKYSDYKRKKKRNGK